VAVCWRLEVWPMGQVEDRWWSTMAGERVRRERFGRGLRWRARYRDAEGRQRSRSFARKPDAVRFLTLVQADLLRGSYIHPGRSRTPLSAYARIWLVSLSVRPTTRAGACDLLLMHQPFGDVYAQWRAMEDLHRQGVVKAIGVSNFYPDRLVDLIQHNEVTPAVNQIECHPYFQRHIDHALMREHGVQIQSWGPFAEGRNNLFSDPTLAAIGAQYDKTVAQVVLRWLIQRGRRRHSRVCPAGAHGREHRRLRLLPQRRRHQPHQRHGHRARRCSSTTATTSGRHA
jgi:hypothetical protein